MDLSGLWKKLQGFPAGKRVFSIILGRKIPYSGSIGARIESLEDGHAKVVMPDRKAVRNHLHSIHAMALANLAELSSGLAAVGTLPSDMRGILVGFKIEYTKKARGTIYADARFALPKSKERQEVIVPVELKDSSDQTVCRAWATWLIGPKT